MNKIARAMYETRLEEASGSDKKRAVLRDAINSAYADGHRARSKEIRNAFYQLGLTSAALEE